MEIQYEKFNALKETVYGIQDHLPKGMYVGAFVCFKQNIPNLLTDHENDELIECANQIHKMFDDAFWEFRNEIEFNVANMGSDGQEIRYMKYLREQVIHFREMLESYFDYEYFSSEEERLMQNLFMTSGRTIYNDYMQDLISRKMPKGVGSYSFTDEELKTKETLMRNCKLMYYDHVGYLARTYLECIIFCRSVIEGIEEKINAIENPNYNLETLKHELTANTHKLILFHKMGLFEPLYTKHRSHIGVVRFAKLIGTLLGISEDKHESFRKSLDDFITETFLKPNNKKTVATPAAERKVDAYLTEIGLTNPE